MSSQPQLANDLPPNPNEDQSAQVQMDYFGFSDEHFFYFPDGLTYVKFSKMNEGEKAKFQKQTSRDLIMERQSGNARMKMDAAADRHALISTCVTDWNLARTNRQTGQLEGIRFNDAALRDFLRLADPSIVEDLELAIRKANPWLMAEMSVEDYDKEIESLQELREEAIKREEGKASSNNK